MTEPRGARGRESGIRGRNDRGRGKNLHDKARNARFDPMLPEDLRLLEWPAEGNGRESPLAGPSVVAADRALQEAMTTLTHQVGRLEVAMAEMRRQLTEMRTETAGIMDMVKTTHSYVLELKALQLKKPTAAKSSLLREGTFS